MRLFPRHHPRSPRPALLSSAGPSLQMDRFPPCPLPHLRKGRLRKLKIKITAQHQVRAVLGCRMFKCDVHLCRTILPPGWRGQSPAGEGQAGATCSGVFVFSPFRQDSPAAPTETRVAERRRRKGQDTVVTCSHNCAFLQDKEGAPRGQRGKEKMHLCFPFVFHLCPISAGQSRRAD